MRDPISGELDYTYTLAVRGDGIQYVVAATDHDLTGAFPWASYTIHWIGGGLSNIVVDHVEAAMDDGSTIRLDNTYFNALLGTPVNSVETWTTRDALGRLDHVLEVYLSPTYSDPRAGFFDPVTFAPPESRRKALDYDPVTGELDYAIFEYRNRTETIDYDSTTGQRDYAVTQHADGRVVAHDYDPRTGLLDYAVTTWADGTLLAEDYDAAGRLDYAVERRPDGRLVATDYDLLDEHPWTTYAITYGGTGLIDNVTIL
jgi:hypothetical protein